MNKYIVSAIVIVLGALVIGGYYYPASSIVTNNVGSPAGSAFNTAKVAAITIAMASAGANATSTSILNSDASDRKIESFVYDCSGVGNSFTAYTGTGLAAWTFTFGTTSTANPNSMGGNTNTAVVSVSTSTPDSYNILGTGTSTPSSLVRNWSANSYLTIQSNATNTAACVVGVHYLAS